MSSKDTSSKVIEGSSKEHRELSKAGAKETAKAERASFKELRL